MSNLISSPYADFIQEQKKQKYLKKIDVSMIASYHIAYYETIIKLKNCVFNTLINSKGKILNKNLMKKINNNIDSVLPYEDYKLMAYHQKPESETEENRIYFYCHSQDNYFDIDKFVCDVIISESAKDRKSEKILKSENSKKLFAMALYLVTCIIKLQIAQVKLEFFYLIKQIMKKQQKNQL